MSLFSDRLLDPDKASESEGLTNINFDDVQQPTQSPLGTLPGPSPFIVFKNPLTHSENSPAFFIILLFVQERTNWKEPIGVRYRLDRNIIIHPGPDT